MASFADERRRDRRDPGSDRRNGVAGADRSDHIEGIGIGFVPPLWDRALVDEIDAVSTEEAMAMARRLAAEEAIFVGTSSGANVVAANRLARRLGPGSTTVTIAVDAGSKYLFTDLFGAPGSTRVEHWVELSAEPGPAGTLRARSARTHML